MASWTSPSRSERCGRHVAPAGLLLALLVATSARAQSLTAFTAQVRVPAAGPAEVKLLLRFQDARSARYSLSSASVRSVEERVRGCDGAVSSQRSVRLDGRLFPALESALPPGCAEVELEYRADEGSRVPLLVPDVKLARGGTVSLEVTSATGPTGATFPTLSWGTDGTGRRAMRHVPALIVLSGVRANDGASPSRAPAGREPGGFGWSFWGFFLCAASYVGIFFLWARYAAGRATA